ncbi:helix-turn-helix transcriptional regulator [Streptomyces sp. DSM 41972]|uniref:Helix-turn-helix transcriptional regulator n=1 Tax=Streptomyces althioticus subsp. attaecolombicae TaxID=3075534 RepID=A0ABU3HZN7_9ACTN|nr:helix-turn-helix transcriptional regulator [Streptomyces sp. DSM 41972]SCD29095.1 Helix-turn-helix domain-containing protein [Streptomyces sp. di50b]SCD91116.1 Helix-turn-helix domain-containing protein [Streptomyces sp. di188]
MSETVREPRGAAAAEEGPEAASQEPGTGILRVFGRQMKRFRLRAGLERSEVGARTGYSVSTITSYELGRRIPPPRFIDVADELLDAGGVLQEMKEEVARAQYPAFFRDAARLETEALALSAYDAQVVNGLLQTEEYARAVFSTMRPPLEDEVIEQRVAARLARQRIFDRRPAPLVSFIMDESVLRRPIGGHGVLRGQLEHLLLVGQKRTVELQVLPLSREQNAGLAGPFMLFDTQEGRRIAYVEVQNVSHVHAEQHLVRGLEAKYGTLRAQALSPQESLTYVENLLGET